MRRILVSAYACEPNVGSEPGVGWDWVTRLSNEFEEVHVVTRSGDRQIGSDGKKYVRNSRDHIESQLSKRTSTDHIHFHYFDLPDMISNLERTMIGDIINIYLWEVMVFFFLLRRFTRREFDKVQKVTIVSHRYPSFVWYFGREYTHGPIAGGERFPVRLLAVFSWKNRIKELVRLVFQFAPFFDPLIWLTYWKADRIIAVTPETRSVLPVPFRKKCLVQQAVSAESMEWENTHRMVPVIKPGEPLKLLYAGRILEWKGVMLILRALKQIHIPYELNVVGDGPDLARIRTYAKSHSLKVNFPGFIERNTLIHYYQTSDLFLFPSLRDSGGFVVLEAQANGLPVLALDLGGPAMNLDENTGILIEVQEQSVEQIVSRIAERIDAFYDLLLNRELKEETIN